MDWETTNANKRSVGAASFAYALMGPSNSDPLDLRIMDESSTVISRTITDLGQQQTVAAPWPADRVRGGQLDLQTAATSQGYTSVKTWDTYLASTKRYTRRELQVGPNAAYRLVATDHDTAGGSNGGSTCIISKPLVGQIV